LAADERDPLAQGIPELSVRVAAAILAAVFGGILPPGSPGKMPGDTAGKDAFRYR